MCRTTNRCLSFIFFFAFFIFSYSSAQESVAAISALPEAASESSQQAPNAASTEPAVLVVPDTNAVPDTNTAVMRVDIDAQAEPLGILDRLQNLLPFSKKIADLGGGDTERSAAKWFFFDLSILIRFAVAIVVIVAQIFLSRFLWALLLSAIKRTEEFGKAKLKPLTFKNYRILTTGQMLAAILFIANILKYVIIAALWIITVIVVFSLFPLTRNLAGTLFGYIWRPLKNIAINFINYIPNLFSIAIILLITRYALKMLKFFTDQLEKGKLVIPGFYADWAKPTFNILRVFIYAFTAAMIYPQLPSSSTDSFKGVSMFLGLVISMGSSSAIGNVVAGMVLTYMRSFKIGDFIKLGDTTGFVVEKTGIVIRLKTPKNEFVTFPNTTVLTSSVTNYHTSLESEYGLLVHKEITMGYDVPWRTVHEILIGAALKVEYVLREPKPFVNQTALDDFYCRYEINAYTRDVDLLSRIYSQLYQHIQDDFTAAGISLYAPHFGVTDVTIANTIQEDK